MKREEGTEGGGKGGERVRELRGEGRGGRGGGEGRWPQRDGRLRCGGEGNPVGCWINLIGGC